MSQTIEIDRQVNAPRAKLHSLPCQIDHNGPARVSSYFHVEPTEDSLSASNLNINKKYESSFRGRSLAGMTVKVPEGYEGKSAVKCYRISKHVFPIAC